MLTQLVCVFIFDEGKISCQTFFIYKNKIEIKLLLILLGRDRVEKQKPELSALL